MNFLRNNKYIGWIVILLAALNVVLLVFIWSGQKRFKKDAPKNGMKLLEERLELDAHQRKQLETIREDHFKEMETLRRNSHEARKALHNLWSQINVEDKVNDLTQRLGTIQSSIEKATYDHFAQIRAVCTPQQQQIFDSMIKDILKRNDPPGMKDGRRPPPKRIR